MKQVAVYLDGERTLDDNGLLILSNVADPQYKAKGELYRTNSYYVGTRERMETPEDILVATFLDGDKAAASYGCIIANITAFDDTINGTYNGTLYFKITIEDR